MTDNNSKHGEPVAIDLASMLLDLLGRQIDRLIEETANELAAHSKANEMVWQAKIHEAVGRANLEKAELARGFANPDALMRLADEAVGELRKLAPGATPRTSGPKTRSKGLR